MLLRRAGGPAIGISQPQHAWLSGELARAWGNGQFESPQPRDAIVCAAALHDIGWLDWELDPQLDPASGLPLEFSDVPAETHTKLWQRGVEHARIYGDYVALLISRHGDAIYERTFDSKTARAEALSAVQRFTVEQRKLQSQLIARIAAEPGMAMAVTADRLDLVKRFIVAVDTISLNLCWGIRDRVEIPEVPQSLAYETVLVLKRIDDHATIVAPWPFCRSEVTFDIRCRHQPSQIKSTVEGDETVVRVTLTES